MRKQVFVGLISFVLSGFTFAQDLQRAPIVEVFGGYSLVHSQVSFSGQNMNGWSATATANVLPWLGTTADFTGYYFRQTYTVNNLPAPLPSSLTTRDTFNFYSFLFGPQVSYRRPRTTLFAHALFGTTRGSFTVQPINTGVLGGATGSNVFSAALGGGADINISRRFALRPLQADYLPGYNFRAITRNSGLWQNSFRYSGGVVVRFGTR